MTRELILGILLEVTRDGEYSHIALRNVLAKYQYLDKKERAFITRVTEGTLEHMIEIDYIIEAVAEVVAYLRSISPLWGDLLKGKREFILK